MALNIILLILGLSAIPPCFFMLTEKELTFADGVVLNIIPVNSVSEITLALIGLAIVVCGLLQLKTRTAYAILNTLFGFLLTALSVFIAAQFISTGSFDIALMHIFGLILLACSFGVISVGLVQLKARFNKDDEKAEQLPETANVMSE